MISRCVCVCASSWIVNVLLYVVSFACVCDVEIMDAITRHAHTRTRILTDTRRLQAADPGAQVVGQIVNTHITNVCVCVFWTVLQITRHYNIFLWYRCCCVLCIKTSDRLLIVYVPITCCLRALYLAFVMYFLLPSCLLRWLQTHILTRTRTPSTHSSSLSSRRIPPPETPARYFDMPFHLSSNQCL